MRMFDFAAEGLPYHMKSKHGSLFGTGENGLITHAIEEPCSRYLSVLMMLGSRKCQL
jgi:hypothetical protein